MFSKYNILLIPFAFMVLSLFAGCSSDGDDNGTGPPSFNVDASLLAAWGKFEIQDYDAALSGFKDVLGHDNTNAEAYIGKGWCYAYQGSLSISILAFDEARSHGTASLDADMGSAVVYRDLPDYSKAVSFAKAVIYVDSNYVFSHRTSVDYKDAHLIMAQSYFHQGESEFDKAAVEMNYLCDILGLSTLPNSTDVTDEEYEKAIATKLEELTDLLSE